MCCSALIPGSKGKLIGCCLNLETKEESTNFLTSFIAADQTLAQTKFYHRTNLAVLLLTPAAIILHPSPLSFPVDVALAIVFPIHAHMGMNWIFTDYVPGSPTGAARMALFAVSVLATLGLLKVSLVGPGITGTLKAFWKEPETKESD